MNDNTVKTTYNHAYTLAFAVEGSTDYLGEDVTASAFRKAILDRLGRLDDDELLEALGLPFDTYEE